MQQSLGESGKVASQAILQVYDEILMCSILQDDRSGDWHQLAQRVYQNFSGLGSALSASEKRDMEKAANAEPWVHMVRPSDLAFPIPSKFEPEMSTASLMEARLQ